MLRRSLAAVIVASAMMAAAGAASATPIQTLSFDGTLAYGSNGTGGPFGTGSYTNLLGDSYSVTLSYDPALFTQSYSDDSCGAASGTSCYFTFSAANPVTEVLTVDGMSETYVATSGGFTLGSSPDSVSFSFQNNGVGLSFSGYLQAGTSLFPDQANVNDPIFSDFTNLSLASAGTFNESGSGFSLGGDPSSLSANYGSASLAVPEPASLALLGTGLFGLGFIRRRRA